MTAREQIRFRLIPFPRRARTDRATLSSLRLALQATIHFLLGAVLAGAPLPGSRAPFAVALTAAAGPGLCGGCTLAGACFGYLLLLEFSSALRYCSCAILVFAVCFAFYDWKLLRRPCSMPLVALLFNGFTGFLVQSRLGWAPSDTVYFLLELVLTAGAAYCYRDALSCLRGRRAMFSSSSRRIGLLVLLATLLMALSSRFLYREISPAPILACTALLAAARQGGLAAGTATGLFLGAALDLTGSKPPLYAMACGLSGMAAGLFRGKRRSAVLPLWLGTYSACLLWTWSRQPPIPQLYEGALGATLYLLFPERLLIRLGARLTPEGVTTGELRARHVAQRKLESTAQAFSSLCRDLTAALRPPENCNDIAGVFDRTANRVCRTCTLRDHCWQQNYTTTFNALNDATPAMVERGRACSGDFPSHFSTRCLHFSDFLSCVNEELTALFCRRQYNARIRENRGAVCRQYAQLADLLADTAAELGQNPTPDPACDQGLHIRIAELGLNVRAAAFRDRRGLLRIEAEGPDCPQLARPSRLADLSSLLGVPLRVEESGENALSLLQQEPLMAVAGVAAQKKSGETVSGDAGTYFKRSDGTLYVLLCDGMGCGPEANRESSLALRLLEQFLQAGVRADHALTTLASALALRGEETGGFTTIDLLQIDLFTGEGMLYKLGAAPTYLRSGEAVLRLAGDSLPAGLSSGSTDGPDRFPLSLSPGDTVLMVSDGICGTGKDDWLLDRLARFDGTSPKDLARELIADSPQDATDDRTALVIRIETRR